MVEHGVLNLWIEAPFFVGLELAVEHPATSKKAPRMTKAEREALQEAFLDAFAHSGVILTACQIAGINRSSVYRWQKSKTFKARYDQALEDANDVLRAEIFRRAHDGWDEPVYQQGELVGTVHKHSDTLMIFLAKSRMPEFKDKSALELTGKDGGPIEHQGLIIDTRNLTQAQLATLKELAKTMKEKEQ